MFPNIKYELHEIERIIAEGELQHDIKKSALTTLDSKLTQEVERIKKTLTHEVFSFEDERHLERYIQFHQSALIGLLDKLNYDVTLDHRRPDLLKMFVNHLDKILRYIERHFAKYFDQDTKAPEAYLTLARKELSESITQLSVGFQPIQADEKLLPLLLQVMQQVVYSSREKGMTFRQVMYAMAVRKELTRLLDRNITGDLSEDLRQIMYYLNYNSTKIVTYHAHYISALLESTETRNEKIEKLSWVLKNISQAQVKPEIKYQPSVPSLKDQLMEYIGVEMEYQERLQRLNASPGQRPDNPFLGFKLKFEASLAQLAYLIRVFLETKLISNSNLTQILHFLTAVAITKKAESISFTSLRTKFYNVELSTKQSVRGMLMAMIHHIDKS